MPTYPELLQRGWSKRMKILRVCVELEYNTSEFLKQIFKLPSGTISFGGKSNALSFEHKLNLMLDLASISKEDRKRFKLLQEMRNKFAHDISALNFEFYYVVTKSNPENDLLKWYPVPNKGTLEQRLTKAVNLWLTDLSRIHYKAEGMIGKRLNASVRDKMNTAALSVHRAKRAEFYDRFEARKSYTGQEVKDIISEIFRDIERESRGAMDVAIQKELRGEE